MKKTISLIIAMIMVLGLFACNRAEQPADPTPAATGAPTAGTTATPAPTATPEPSSEPTPTEILLPENPGDFAASSGSFYWDQSSELHNILLDIYPVDDKKAVIQINSLDGSEDEEIVTEMNCSLTFELVNKAVYRNDAADITLTIDSEEHVTVTAGNDRYAMFNGNYYPTDGKSWLNPDTIIEYLRNIPASGIGDFGTAEKADEINEVLADNWFREITLYRDDSVYGIYVAAEDMSMIGKVNDMGSLDIIFGSMENSLEKTNYYDFEFGSEFDEEDGEENIDEYSEEYSFFEQPIIYPYLISGAYMTVGQSDNVAVRAAWDLTEDIKVNSRDESILTVNGTEVTAVGEGEAVLDVELVYGGCTKDYTIEVTVVEADPDAVFETVEYEDPDCLSLVDRVTFNYTMDITNNDGLYSVDIISILDPGTYRHWSYFGEADPSDPNVITLQGDLSLITYQNDGSMDETLKVEGVTATIIKNADGTWSWNDDHGNEGGLSVFE